MPSKHVNEASGPAWGSGRPPKEVSYHTMTRIGASWEGRGIPHQRGQRPVWPHHWGEWLCITGVLGGLARNWTLIFVWVLFLEERQSPRG